MLKVKAIITILQRNSVLNYNFGKVDDLTAHETGEMFYKGKPFFLVCLGEKTSIIEDSGGFSTRALLLRNLEKPINSPMHPCIFTMSLWLKHSVISSALASIHVNLSRWRAPLTAKQCCLNWTLIRYQALRLLKLPNPQIVVHLHLQCIPAQLPKRTKSLELKNLDWALWSWRRKV